MNFVFISPHFPHTYWQFCQWLYQNGVKVLGIADAPYDSLQRELKKSLTEYYRVNSLENYDELNKALIAMTGINCAQWEGVWLKTFLTGHQ